MTHYPHTCKDQMGREVTLNKVPETIVSLVPSQTELLYDLGLENEIVGITKFCIHPKHWQKEKEQVGGTKKIHVEKIKQLNPDLIIGNKEENEKEQIEQLAAKYNVWMSDITSIDHAIEMIEDLGNIVNKSAKAQEITSQLKLSVENLKIHAHKYPHLNVLYFIWSKPFMVAGNNTFTN